jgi:hypothetical protein
MPVIGATRFQDFFREVAGLDVDDNDLKRFDDFVHRKLRDLLVVGEATAKANLRDVILPHDLPITAGLETCIHQFQRVDHQVETRPILEQLATYPPLDLALGDETEQALPDIAGGISVALARAFKLIDTEVENPSTSHWQRAFDLFGLLL